MKFAHLSDTHIGAYREAVLAELSMEAFSKALDECVERNVDFILISGDLFHSGVPDLSAVDEAVKKIKEVKEKKIPFYTIYGSHDYNPSGTSIIDILDSTGLIEKIVKGEVVEGKLKLRFTVDPETRCKLVGISARKMGLESEYYEILDRRSLEKEPGFKIFAFHSALDEFKPRHLSRMKSIPLSYLPKGFDYYAGGHVHEKSEFSKPDYERIVFPGPLFAGYPRDFQANAKGEKRGFFIVEFEDKVESVEFVPVEVCEYAYYEYDASNKNSVRAYKELKEALQTLEVEDKLVFLRVHGELAGGKTSDLNFTELRRALKEKGALHVHLNRFALTSQEYTNIKIMGDDVKIIEDRLLKDNIGSVKVSNKKLRGEEGVGLASELLSMLRQDQKMGETKKDYEARIVDEAVETLKLKEAMR